MVYVTDTESWQRIFQLMSEKSRWDLPDSDVDAYLTRSFDFIVDFLRRVEESGAVRARPVGRRAASAREARTARRTSARRRGAGGDRSTSAFRHAELETCSSLEPSLSPLYPLARAESN